MKKETIEEIKTEIKRNGFYYLMAIMLTFIFGYSFDKTPKEFLYLKITLASLITVVYILQMIQWRNYNEHSP